MFYRTGEVAGSCQVDAVYNLLPEDAVPAGLIQVELKLNYLLLSRQVGYPSDHAYYILT